MEKNIEKWPIEKLREMYSQIDFPEYQREPNLWSATEKQRLIDSIIRHFDIAPLYLYRHGMGSFDCVDGRQRIGTIMSFLGSGQDDGSDFRFRILNEIYDEETPSFHALEGKTFADIDLLAKQSDETAAKEFVDSLLKYQLNVVILSDSNRSEEFNLQFTRLNLGTIINSGKTPCDGRGPQERLLRLVRKPPFSPSNENPYQTLRAGASCGPDLGAGVFSRGI